MKISIQSQYAAKAMLVLAVNPEKPLKLSCLAQSLGISIYYLKEIFFLLCKAKLIKSTQGRNGGYRLGKPVNDIAVGDIVALF